MMKNYDNLIKKNLTISYIVSIWLFMLLAFAYFYTSTAIASIFGASILVLIVYNTHIIKILKGL
jgi:hypothetical protein